MSVGWRDLPADTGAPVALRLTPVRGAIVADDENARRIRRERSRRLYRATIKPLQRVAAQRGTIVAAGIFGCMVMVP